MDRTSQGQRDQTISNHSHFSIVVLKYHGWASYRGKSLSGLMGSNGEESLMVGGKAADKHGNEAGD